MRDTILKKYQICAAVFWVALGVFVCFYSYRLGLGRVRNPGPGLFPFFLGLIFLLLAVIILIKALLEAEQNRVRVEGENPVNVLKVGMVAAILLAYAVLLGALGFVVTTFLSLTLLFRLGGYTRWVQVLGYAAAVVVITYFLFTYLGVQFPPGVLRLLGLA